MGWWDSGWALGSEGSPARIMGSGGECYKHDAMEHGRDVADILPSGVSQEKERQKQLMVVACKCPWWLPLDFPLNQGSSQIVIL